MSISRNMAEVIQNYAPLEIEDAYCLGFVTVSEWVSSDGNRYLTTIHGDHNGDPLPFWQIDGYLQNAPINDDEED